MNDNSSEKLTPQMACLCHIIAMKYALAGDLESTDALETLFQRVALIEWSDPAFVRLSEEMRAGLPHLTPEQEEGLEPSMQALAHAQNERLAELHEAQNDRKGLYKTIIENVKTSIENQGRLFKYTKALLDLNLAMRNRLEMLGADVSEFEVPELQ